MLERSEMHEILYPEFRIDPASHVYVDEPDLRKELGNQPLMKLLDAFREGDHGLYVSARVGVNFQGWFDIYADRLNVVLVHRRGGMMLLNPTIFEVVNFLDTFSRVENGFPGCALNECDDSKYTVVCVPS